MIKSGLGSRLGSEPLLTPIYGGSEVAFQVQTPGADERIRTADLLFTKQLLYP